MARLDRLGPAAKGVAQIGAAIGREFSYELAASVGELAEEVFQKALQRLVDAGLVFQRGAPPTAEYLFKHALVQEAAYGTLLRRTRQQLHARIAAAFEATSPRADGLRPELFAQHYAEAGLVEKSVACWGQAGRKSVARSAMAEAAAQLQKGLDQLALLPDDRERQQQELELRRTLGAALMTAKGLAAVETGHVLARSRELWEQLGSPMEFIGVPYGQTTYHALRGELDRALDLAEDLLRLSRQHKDTAGLLLGHSSAGRTLMFAGRFGPSRSHLEEALALYDQISHHALVDHVGFHAHINSKGYLGNALSCLGFPDQAFAHISTAIAEARRLAHPPSLAGSLTQGAVLLSFNGNDAILAEWTESFVR